MICVLVVDDDGLFNRAVHRHLEQVGQRALCATTVAEAVAVLEREEVDLVLLDLMLGGERGEDLLDRVPNSKMPLVVVVTGSIDDARLSRLRERGIAVFGKPLAADFLSVVVKGVDSEENRLDLCVARMKLSKREKEALLAAIEGLSEGETAALMSCSVGTVRTYWDRIKHKFGSQSKFEALCAVTRSAFRISRKR